MRRRDLLVPKLARVGRPSHARRHNRGRRSWGGRSGSCARTCQILRPTTPARCTWPAFPLSAVHLMTRTSRTRPMALASCSAWLTAAAIIRLRTASSYGTRCQPGSCRHRLAGLGMRPLQAVRRAGRPVVSRLRCQALKMAFPLACLPWCVLMVIISTVTVMS